MRKFWIQYYHVLISLLFLDINRLKAYKTYFTDRSKKNVQPFKKNVLDLVTPYERIKLYYDLEIPF